MVDKELYRQAYAQLQEWSEAAERERMLEAAQLSPGERWRQFQALVAFCRSIQPQQSSFERAEKLAALDRFSHAVRELERWKRDHDKPENPLIVSVLVQDVIVDFLLA